MTVREISGVIISYNEEAKIRAALSSLHGVCDEIVVVDSCSEDATVDICREFTSCIHEKPWSGYREQKQFAADQASFDWVLSLDADEELSSELRNELLSWKEADGSEYDGYLIPRVTFFLGRWIRHTTWYPDRQLRLFRRSRGAWIGKRVHEGFKVRGKTGRLRGHIRHYTYTSVSEYLEQLERFSSLAACDEHERGTKAGLGHLVFHPPMAFAKNYLLRLGFLDGVPGLVVSVLAATSVFFKHLTLWELQRVSTRSVLQRPRSR